jgi:hypothetical protein
VRARPNIGHSQPQSNHSSCKIFTFINGQWFDGKSFQLQTFFSDDGMLTNKKPPAEPECQAFISRGEPFMRIKLNDQWSVASGRESGFRRQRRTSFGGIGAVASYRELSSPSKIKLCLAMPLLFCFLPQATYLLLTSDFARAQTPLKYGTTEVQPGTAKTFFTDWDLCTDNSNNTAVGKQALKTGQSYFQGSMDKYGRIIELRYYDLSWDHRWTKRFDYGRNGRYRYRYFAANGQRINHQKQEALVRRHYFQKLGTSKEKIRESLGDPVIIQIDLFGMETWRYFDGIEQHWYTFNEKGELDYSNYKQ